MDGEAIYSALVANAASPTPTLPVFDTPTAAQPTTAQLTGAILGDEQSERIYQALVRAAAATTLQPSESIPMPTPPSTLPGKLSALATDGEPSDVTRTYAGFMTSRFATLPSAATILLGVFLIVLALACLAAGARSLYVGRDLGRTYGSNERKGWLRGGIGGIFFGSTASGVLITVLTLLIVSRQEEATLDSWGLVSIIVLCSLPGAIAGGRWSWFSRSSVALIGSTSLALLVVVSFHVSSTLPRLILALVFVILSQLAVHLRLSQRYSLPVLAALSGSFLLVLGIDVFLHSGFIDVLGLLITAKGVGAGRGGHEGQEVVVDRSSSRAKGVVAGWWILSIASSCWQVWWGLGTEGQDLWNEYLARYVKTSDPRGTHLPPLSFFDRARSLFSDRANRHEAFTRFSQRPSRRRTPWDEIEEEDDDDDKLDDYKGLAHIGLAGRGKREGSDTWDSDIETLASRRSKRQSMERPRASRKESSKPAQYGAVDSSDEEEDDDAKGGRLDLDSESTKSLGVLSETTLVSSSRTESGGRGKGGGLGHERKKLEKAFEGRADDPREDRQSSHRLPVETPRSPSTRSMSEPPSPLLPHERARDDDDGKERGSLFARIFSHTTRTSPKRSAGPRLRPPSNLGAHESTGRVAATPSLITAIERVRAAQRQAREAASQTRSTSSSSSFALDPGRSDSGDFTGRSTRTSMDEFWKAVVDQASTSASARP